ncbi:Uncharacterized homolog of phage Mu protein gp47 [uncultured Flavonifractor sp.]|nr:Uncharacterized homolog of phage Mu protein gp47 [uncultured Flavonifractor sp.]
MTKEEALNLMTEAYNGPGSTDEGTFVGDILRACADAIAQMWSMDVDGLARRAFVSTAVGDWLTAVCADRGVERLDGEDDDSLRQRTLKKLSGSPTSGNADHYIQWCTSVPQVLRAKVFPLRRGAGTVDVTIVDTDGRAPQEEVRAAAQAVVDQQRPVGVDAKVTAPTETPIQVSASVTLMDGAQLEPVKAQLQEEMAAFLKEIALNTQTVSYAKALRLLLDCAGVADVTGFTLNGGDESLVLAEDAVGVCGEILLQEVS